MTATDELRRMLDERGVEWDADDETMDDGSLSQVTYWYCNGIEWSTDGRDEYLAFDAVQLITPAQAIAATLGSGTCKNMDGETDAEWFSCSECNTELRIHEPFDAFSIHFCPNCGRKVMMTWTQLMS